MTETIESTARDAAAERFAIDPIAFFKALVAAPLIVALFGCWALAIPVFAVVFGGPAYLIFGTPVLLIYLHVRSGDPGQIALLALAVMVVLLLIPVMAEMSDIGNHSVRAGFLDVASGMGLWGLIFAPLWGFAFGKLYNRWRSPASRRPLPPLA